MTNQQTSRILTITILTLALIIPGCSGSPTEPEITLDGLLARFKVQIGANASGGSAFSVSAAMRPNRGLQAASVLQEVHVFIQSFRVATSAGTVITFDGIDRDVDLMTLRGQEIDLVDAEVPRGTFNDIQFDIDPTRSYVVSDGEQRTLSFATDTVSVVGPIVVGDAPLTTVRLEFDVDQSLTENADGTWTMAPVVVISITTG